MNQKALGNANLGWETTESWNTGFESAWLGSRLFVDLDLYFSKTTDQIFTRDIPVMTGFKNMKSSMGQVNNRGGRIDNSFREYRYTGLVLDDKLDILAEPQ